MFLSIRTQALRLGLLFMTASATPLRDGECDSSRITLPEFEGIEILDIRTLERRNYTFPANPYTMSDEVPGLNICNITVAYTHTGWNDTVNVHTWVPLEQSGWNGRFLGNGGGGFITGGYGSEGNYMAPLTSLGFASSTTDGGHTDDGMGSNGYSSWALTAKGNLNWPLIYDFASTGLHDMTVIGKAVVEVYYDKAPEFAYFVGASTGGRQANMMAQKYPDDYDGIIGGAPALNWPKFLLSDIWAFFIMNSLNYYPRPCEVEAFTNAAIDKCDALDGVEDGLIAFPGLCQFDPHKLVGQTFDCDGAEAVFSEEGAQVVQAAWDGPRSSKGEFQWYGFPYDADISSLGAQTECSKNGTCIPLGFSISYDYVSHWIEKDPDFDFHSIDHEKWDRIFHDSVDQYESLIGTSNADLTGFKNSGGKFICWHGIADRAIPGNSTVDFVDDVLQRHPDSDDFYRFFLAPGDSHGMIGFRPTPQTLMDALIDWVENGKGPEMLRSPGTGRQGQEMTRDLCLYPKISHFVEGDPTVASSFECI